jgi:hypothetical protein
LLSPLLPATAGQGPHACVSIASALLLSVVRSCLLLVWRRRRLLRRALSLHIWMCNASLGGPLISNSIPAPSTVMRSKGARGGGSTPKLSGFKSIP